MMHLHHDHDRQDELRPIHVADLIIDLNNRLISFPDGTTTLLTLREREVLRLLIHSPGRVLSYAMLGQDAWHDPNSASSLDGIRYCICRLRRKLGDARAIESVRNVGYRFRQDKSRR